jgi:hypothetical protein
MRSRVGGVAWSPRGSARAPTHPLSARPQAQRSQLKALWLDSPRRDSSRTFPPDSSTLLVRGCPGVFAISDTAASTGWAGGVWSLASRPPASSRDACRARDPGGDRERSSAGCLSLPASRQSRDDPALGCCPGSALASVVGSARLMALGPCRRVAPRGWTQPRHRRAELALGLPDLPARHPPHHWEYDGRLSDHP